MIAESISGRFTSLVSTRISFLVTSIFVSGGDPHTNFPTSSMREVVLPFFLLENVRPPRSSEGGAFFFSNVHASSTPPAGCLTPRLLGSLTPWLRLFQ